MDRGQTRAGSGERDHVVPGVVEVIFQELINGSRQRAQMSSQCVVNVPQRRPRKAHLHAVASIGHFRTLARPPLRIGPVEAVPPRQLEHAIAV